MAWDRYAPGGVVSLAYHGVPRLASFGRFHDTSAGFTQQVLFSGLAMPCPNLLHSILGCTYYSSSLKYMQRLGLPNYILFTSGSSRYSYTTQHKQVTDTA